MKNIVNAPHTSAALESHILHHLNIDLRAAMVAGHHCNVKLMLCRIGEKNKKHFIISFYLYINCSFINICAINAELPGLD